MKVRITFDCSAKIEGVLLNVIIYARPKLQQELFDVLVHFLRGLVALACNIREMYLQDKIDEKDCLMFCILWRN